MRSSAVLRYSSRYVPVTVQVARTPVVVAARAPRRLDAEGMVASRGPFSCARAARRCRVACSRQAQVLARRLHTCVRFAAAWRGPAAVYPPVLAGYGLAARDDPPSEKRQPGSSARSPVFFRRIAISSLRSRVCISAKHNSTASVTPQPDRVPTMQHVPRLTRPRRSPAGRDPRLDPGAGETQSAAPRAVATGFRPKVIKGVMAHAALSRAPPWQKLAPGQRLTRSLVPAGARVHAAQRAAAQADPSAPHR